MPEISVVIPVFNSEKYIKQCIDSVLKQIYCGFEIIIVDDGSTDNSGSICDEFAKEHSFIKVIHQKNKGQSAARNAGVRAAKSDLLCFIDSDDIVHPDMLRAMYAEYKKGGVGAVTCERISGAEPEESFFDSVAAEAERIKTDESALLKLYRDKSTVYWTLFPCLIKKSIYEIYPLEEGRIMEDNAVTCKWLVESGCVSVLHAPLYFYRDNPEGTMHSAFSEKRLDFLWALREQISFYKSLRYDTMRGEVAKEYIMTALWFAGRAEDELNDPGLARRLAKDAVNIRSENSNVLKLTESEERKLFKANHPYLHRLRKHFGK